MVTLGFFVVGGRRSSPYIENGGDIGPDISIRVTNDLAPSCHTCLRHELRCDALEAPWQQECKKYAEGLMLMEATSCGVQNYVGSKIDANRMAMKFPVEECASLCKTECDAKQYDLSFGYERPFLR